MESMDELKSILPFLPLVIRCSSLFWPSQVVEALKAMSMGPQHSKVDSGEVLLLAITDIRSSLSLSSDHLARSAPQGYALFFDELISRQESIEWFDNVVPEMAKLLLKLPSLLEQHYLNTDGLIGGGKYGVRSCLHLLGPQKGGMVFLSQELIGALLACAFFCFFPEANRGAKHLPRINFDQLFADFCNRYDEKMENKIKCIIHYFKRITSSMPKGFVSFERKVLPLRFGPECISYPEADFWSKSVVPLCNFEVHNSGLIEDQCSGALEVDFANRYLGGGALRSGCVQEEIRFMINPELIAGMLFLPAMEDNESIEIIGAERFSNYRGYASTFRFVGDCMDNRDIDNFGRRKTRIIAVDALCNPKTRQYEPECLLREINKAFCGFFDQTMYQQYKTLYQGSGPIGRNVTSCKHTTGYDILMDEASPSSNEADSVSQELCYVEKLNKHHSQSTNIGIATGNWGCGAFGGDPELKAIIQWLAASQALRPFISYYTFGIEELKNLDQVTRWILSHEWTVGDLWNMLLEYSSQRLKKETKLGFLEWLLPSPSGYDIELSD